MIESHIDPDNALSNSAQQITPGALIQMLSRLKPRDAVTSDHELKAKLAHLQALISHTETKILQSLAERMRYIEEIGLLKQDYNIPVLQLGRCGTLPKDHITKA